MRASPLLLALVLSQSLGCAQRSLEVTKEGAGAGPVVSTGGAEIDCGATCTAAMSGQAIDLTATPDDDSDFAGWGCTYFAAADDTAALTTVSSLDETFTIGAAPVASPTGPVAFDRVAKAVCTATFTVEPVLTVVVDGPGQVTSATDAVDIDCGADCDESVTRGTIVELTAVAGDNRFVGWSEGCSGTSTTTTVTVAGPTECKATFVDPATRAELTLAVVGEGTFSSSPAGISGCGATSGTCTAEFATDTAIALTGALPEGHTVQSWSAGCANGAVTLAADTTCTVVVQAPPATVTWNAFLTKSGGATGTVTSAPAGIDCGEACSSADDVFVDVTTVSLTGTAAAAATFGGFACSCSFSGVAPGTVTCATTGGTGPTAPTIDLTLDGLANARGRDVVVRLDCAATFTP
jgi:hypothetical protein